MKEKLAGSHRLRGRKLILLCFSVSSAWAPPSPPLLYTGRARGQILTGLRPAGRGQPSAEKLTGRGQGKSLCSGLLIPVSHLSALRGVARCSDPTARGCQLPQPVCCTGIRDRGPQAFRQPTRVREVGLTQPSSPRGEDPPLHRGRKERENKERGEGRKKRRQANVFTTFKMHLDFQVHF